MKRRLTRYFSVAFLVAFVAYHLVSTGGLLVALVH
jgi:hypothetical protein